MAFNASLHNSLMKLVSHREGTLSAISSSHQGQIPLQDGPCRKPKKRTMFTRQFVLLTATVAAMACSSVSEASPIQVDGVLSDWDVVVSDGNECNFYHLYPSIGLLGYHRDDQCDSVGVGGYLGRRGGG